MNKNLKNALTVLATTILTIAIIFVRMTNFSGFDGTKIGTLKALDAFTCFATLFVGLFYQIKEYKKEASVFYKLFMLLLVSNAVVSIIIPLTYFLQNKPVNNNYLIVAIGYLIIALCYLILTFVKDLGESNTKIMSIVVIVINTLLLVNSIIKGYSLEYLYASIGSLLIAFLAYAFINAKYSDKESRGTE